ncbi:nucleotidyltransferase domain-containing protein [Pseudomonas sp. NBRC 111119]|uniref:nucleotidyltransferase domain-containing protein n=1 Tax=Pseudomonas sp. NBRC 111119 TaxID=1661034 RepID=UPI000761BD63|nr:nucleotidyltransferase domain-containing protein [Pseudomonas sp. NBRC 111119]
MRVQLIGECAQPGLQPQVQAAISRMERECPVRILYYSLMGSIPLGMGNASSDYDLLAVYQPRAALTAAQYDIINNKTPLLGAAHIPGEVNMLLADNALFSPAFMEMPEAMLIQAYPQHLNTLTVHDRAFDIAVLPGDNSPKAASIFSDLFYYGNGVLTDRQGTLRRDFSTLKRCLRVYEFCKRRYVTTYGRLQHYLVKPGNVRLRTYLQSINDLLAIEYALDHRDIPAPDISVMLEHLDDAQVLETARRFLTVNAQANTAKEKLLIDPDDVLNRWIAGRLARIKPRLLALYPHRSEVLFEVVIG